MNMSNPVNLSVTVSAANTHRAEGPGRAVVSLADRRVLVIVLAPGIGVSSKVEIEGARLHLTRDEARQLGDALLTFADRAEQGLQS